MSHGLQCRTSHATRVAVEAALSPRHLTRLARAIYSRGRPLSLHERLTTIYRPLYAPLGEVLRWVPEGATMLDVGCGTGTLLLLADRLRTLRRGFGHDVRAEPLAVARAVADPARITLACSPEVPADTIRQAEVVSVVDVLHHVPPAVRTEFLTRLVGAAMPGAVFVFKDLDPRPRWRALANHLTDWLSTRSRVDYLAMDELATLLADGGFEILDRRRLHRHVWSHYLVVARRRS